MNSTTSEWLVLTRNLLAGFNPQNDIHGVLAYFITNASETIDNTQG